MLAVIETGGKQYLIKGGDILKIEKLEVEAGKEVIFDKILLLADDDGSNVKLGNPYLDGTSITAVVEEQGRSKKIRVVKFRHKSRYHRTHGHRQSFTKIKVEKK